MLIGLIIAFMGVVVDQVSKILIEINLTTSSNIEVIPNFLYITKDYNTGAGWSLFSDSTLFLAILSLVAAVFFVFLLRKMEFRKYKLLTIGTGLAIGGTIGNMIDRFLCVAKQRDGVIDFISTIFGSYHFPVFNVADMCLTIGLVLVCIDLFIFDGKREVPFIKEHGHETSSTDEEIEEDKEVSDKDE